MMSRISIAVFALVLVFSACKKKDSNPEPEPAPTTTGTPAPAPIDINHVATAVYVVDGVNFSYTDDVNNVQAGVGSSRSINSSGGLSTVIYGSFFTHSKNNKSYFAIDRGTMSYDITETGDTTAFKAFFAPGMYNYSVGPLNGVVVEHWDANDVLWSSQKGTAGQTGSVFKIEAYKFTDIPMSGETMKVYATFNCKLYDGNGNSKTLTNGKYVGYFQDI